ncbi:hypothetical protein KY339_00405 [Candidatus Woesearchaeota archaeon]|nr:hypothetical protein [Candidatus Woesearchaeota archaeon]
MDGVAGIYSPNDGELVNNIFLATSALQHRGKYSAGIAVGNGKGIYCINGLGGVSDIITPNQIVTHQDLEPVAAIGNVGYTKNKYPSRRNSEPIGVNPKTNSQYQIYLTLDGYLVKEDDLRAELESDYGFETQNKTEVIGALLHKYITEEGISFEAGKRLVDKLHGMATFALTALVYDGKETHLVTLNDSRAFEPFCYGTIDNAFVASSESSSHRRLGGFIEREYDGAEMSICSSKGIETRRLREETLMPDIFQGVYFGNVASLFRGKEIFQLRRELGLGLIEHYGISDSNITIPNPDSGWGVTMGIFEGTFNALEKKALDYSKLDEGIIKVKNRKAFDRLRERKTVYPALIKLAQAVRTFQESQQRARSVEVGLKFGGIDSLLKGKVIDMGDDSIVRGSVSEGGSIAVTYNAGAEGIVFWISYGPMFFPSFKQWHRGRECFDELAVQRAFKGQNPYDKSPEEINTAVAKLIGVDEVKYNTKKVIENVAGSGSFQALDASYPIKEPFWPEWLRTEVEWFHKFRK